MELPSTCNCTKLLLATRVILVLVLARQVDAGMQPPGQALICCFERLGAAHPGAPGRQWLLCHRTSGYLDSQCDRPYTVCDSCCDVDYDCRCDTYCPVAQRQYRLPHGCSTPKRRERSLIWWVSMGLGGLLLVGEQRFLPPPPLATSTAHGLGRAAATVTFCIQRCRRRSSTVRVVGRNSAFSATQVQGGRTAMTHHPALFTIGHPYGCQSTVLQIFEHFSSKLRFTLRSYDVRGYITHRAATPCRPSAQRCPAPRAQPAPNPRPGAQQSDPRR
jgi:hypothetical protein